MHKIKNNQLAEAFHTARALSNQTLIRPREAAAMLGISRKHLYALAHHPDFPKRIHVSARVVAWRVCDLEDWIAARLSQPTFNLEAGNE